jgi:hypothetical protein
MKYLWRILLQRQISKQNGALPNNRHNLKNSRYVLSKQEGNEQAENPSHATVILRCTARRELMRECRATWFPTPSKWKTTVAFPSFRGSHYFLTPPHPSQGPRAQCCPWSSQLRNILYDTCLLVRDIGSSIWVLICLNFVYGLKKTYR